MNLYITEGGFPRTVFITDETDKQTYVRGVINEIFEKDIKRRVKIRDRESFEAVQKYIVNNFGATTSINRLCENLRKNGMRITKPTVYIYARAHDYSISVGRIGKLECDFILRRGNNQYSYAQVAYTIASNKDTEDREYRPLEQIRDNYPKYVMTTDMLLQKRNEIHHINLMDFMKEGKTF